mgnify:CR=1 FL=1
MALDPKNFRPEVIAGSTAGALSGVAPVAGGAVAVTLGDSTTPSVLVGSGVPTFVQMVHQSAPVHTLQWMVLVHGLLLLR